MCIGRPIYKSDVNFTVLEETTPLVADLDVDIEDQGTYEIVGGPDASAFSINTETGLLQFRGGAPNFEQPKDAGQDNLYNLTVKFTDFSGASVTRELQVTVENDPGDDVSEGKGRILGQVRNDSDGDGDLGDADSGLAGATVQLFADANGDFQEDGGAIAFWMSV